MNLDRPDTLFGGISANAFMRRHWQRRPLLVRQAMPGVTPPLARRELFALAARDDVESRLVLRDERGWRLRHGPLGPRALPPLKTPGWTLLVQGLDLHVDGAREMLNRFRFLPDARLDDLMLSYASDGGGVGPHLDSYDVFLLQVQGRRRWRIGRVRDKSLVDGAPLKLLANFKAEAQWILEPGDMLYLPPQWGHDGEALGGECMTCSIGFRASTAGDLAREVLLRAADALDGEGARYRDAAQPATATPGRVPASLQAFAARAVALALRERGGIGAAAGGAIGRALGEVLSEPKANVWFDAGCEPADSQGVHLHRRTRMLYDDHHVFINGESFAAHGRDAGLMQRLADTRALDARACARLSAGARELLDGWARAGWLVAQNEVHEKEQSR